MTARQVSLEKKGIVLCLICAAVGLLALTRVLVDITARICTAMLVVNGTDKKPRKLCCASSSWILLLASCSTILFIISL